MTSYEVAAIILCVIMSIPLVFCGIAVWKVAKHFLDARARAKARRERPRR